MCFYRQNVNWCTIKTIKVFKMVIQKLAFQNKREKYKTTLRREESRK